MGEVYTAFARSKAYGSYGKMSKKEIKSSYKHHREDERRMYKENKKKIKDDYRQRRLSDRDELRDALDREYMARGTAYKDPPRRGLLEEIGNATTHGVGAVFAVVALVLMCLSAENPTEYVGAAIYSAGLGIMFCISCLYHALPHGSCVKRIFRRFDYSCIYLLIGATFAPILLCYIGDVFGLVFFILQWAVIITGISLVGVFGPGRLRFIHIPLYFILGWCGIILLPVMISRGDYAFLAYILGGGIIYSLGIIPFALKKRVAHFIWHFFVLAGAVVQWIGVYLTIYVK